MNDGPLVVLGFDMETDVGSWTPFYEGFKKGTPVILKLLAKHGAQATFYFTGESANKFPRTVKTVAEEGHEVGAHSIYHETVGDQLFDIPGVKPLLCEEVPLRLKRCHEIVADAVGRAPTSFRAPRLFGSTTMINSLEKLGYGTDASYPMYFFEKQLVPYHPSKKDWTEKGKLKILEIPNFADMTIESKDPYGRDRDQWPLFRTKGHRPLLKHIDNFLGLLAKKKLPAVLCFYFHPWEFHEMKASYTYGEGTVAPFRFITKNCGAVAAREFDLMLSELEKRGARFVSAGTLSRQLETPCNQ